MARTLTLACGMQVDMDVQQPGGKPLTKFKSSKRKKQDEARKQRSRVVASRVAVGPHFSSHPLLQMGQGKYIQ